MRTSAAQHSEPHENVGQTSKCSWRAQVRSHRTGRKPDAGSRPKFRTESAAQSSDVDEIRRHRHPDVTETRLAVVSRFGGLSPKLAPPHQTALVANHLRNPVLHASESGPFLGGRPKMGSRGPTCEMGSPCRICLSAFRVETTVVVTLLGVRGPRTPRCLDFRKSDRLQRSRRESRTK